MRKAELANCPQWLLDAETFGEDVELENGVLVWQGGDWQGGDWWGGVWRGGKIRDRECKLVLTFAHCEGYAKTLVDVAGTAYVLAGCHFFTLDEARTHWGWRADRPYTRALLAGAYELAKLLGLRTGGADVP